MPSDGNPLKKGAATRDLITWVVSTLAAIVALVGAFLALVHPSAKDKPSAAASVTRAGSTPSNTAQAVGVTAEGGSVAIGGSVTGSNINVGATPPAKTAK